MRKPSKFLAKLVLLAVLPSMVHAENFIRLPAPVEASVTSGVTDSTGEIPPLLLRAERDLIDFGPQTIQRVSDERSVTLTNKGSETLAITDIRLSASLQHYLVWMDDCVKVIEPGQTCTGSIAYAPKTLTTHGAQLVATLEDGTQLNVAAVTGQGVQGTASFNASGVSFTGLQIGQTSEPRVLRLTNTGKGVLGLDSLVLTGDASFAMDSQCPDSLAPGQGCDISVTVTPPDALNRSATVTLYASGTLTRVTRVQLTSSAQQLVLRDLNGSTLNSLTVPSTMAGTESPTALFGVHNTGTISASVGAPSVPAPFKIASNNCPATLVAGQSCRIGVAAQASQPQRYSATLSLPTGTSPLTLPLAHTATAPAAELSTYDLAFGRQTVGLPGPSQRIALFNRGEGPLSIGAISVSPEFFATTDCSAQLAVGEMCHVDVSFVAQAAGPRVGVLTVATAAGDQVVSLSGTGLTLSSTLDQSDVSFGGQRVGTTSTARTVQLLNDGEVDLEVDSLMVSGPFSASHNCAQTLKSGESCLVSVRFSPVQAGPATGSVALTTSAGVRTVSLGGTGLLPLMTAAPSTLEFGSVQTGSASEAQTVTVSNPGNVNLTSLKVDVPAGFVLLNSTCSEILSAGASCAVEVSFRPTQVKAYSATLAASSAEVSRSVGLSGTGAAAAASLSASSLDFGAQPVGEASPVRTLTLSNTGVGPVTVEVPVATGAFSASSNCPTQLAKGASCTIQLGFLPTAMGAATGTLTVGSSAGSLTASLSGTGLQTAASLSAENLVFDNVAVGTTSAVQQVALYNQGNQPVGVSAISVTGPFAVTHNCGALPASVNVGGSCVLGVTMTPLARGAASGLLLVTTAAGTKTVNLSGTGLQATAELSIDVASFGNTMVGEGSSSRTVTLTNTGNAPLTLSAPTTSGPFSATSTCGATLAVNTSCAVTVVFTPTAMGPATGTLTLVTGLGTKTVELNGYGQQASLGLSASLLDLGSANFGEASAPKALSLQNTGNLPVSVSAIGVTGPFTVSHNCGALPASVAVGGNCTVNVTMTATTRGPVTGTLTVSTSSGLLTAQLEGLVLQPGVQLSAASLSFDNVAVGATSAARSVTVTNDGNTVLTLGTPAVSAPFALSSNSCGTSLAAGGSCTYQVTFTPTVRGAATGTLSFNTGAGAQSVSLSGIGLLAGAVLTPTSLSFPATAVTGTSSSQTITLTNDGNTALTVSPATVSGPFSLVSTTCGSSLAGGSQCTYSVSFMPTVMGTASGALNVGTSVGARQVSLSGTGLQANASVNAATLSFGNQQVGTTSSVQSVTLSNSGNTPTGITAVSTTGPFAATHNCGALPASLAGGSNCSINVTFTPTARDAASGTLTVVTGVSTQTINLTGFGLQATAALTNAAASATLSFTNTTVGSTSSAMTVTLSNSGNMALSLSAPTTSGPFAVSGNTCSTSLAAGSSCVISVTFTPTIMGTASGSLTLSTGAGTQVMPLSGTGLLSALGASSTTLTLGSVQVGQTATSSTLTLNNTGNVNLTALSISAPAGYAVTGSSCGTTLAVGASCSFALQFSPVAAQAYNGTLSVTSSAPTVSVAVTGTGAAQLVEKYSPDNFSYDVPHATSSGHFIGIVNNGYGPVTVNGISSTSSSGGFTAWMANSGTGNPNGGYCWPGVVLQPGWRCGAWAQDGGAAIGAVSAGTATFSTSAGNVTYTGSLTARGLSYSTTTGASMAATSGQTGTVYTLTISNPTVFPFYFPKFGSVGGVANLGRFTGTHAANFVLTGTTCGASLAASSSCSVTVAATNVPTGGLYSASFQPNGTYQQSGSGTPWGWSSGNWLVNMGTTIADVFVAPTTAVSVTVLKAIPSVSPGSLSFASTNVGATSAAQSVTLSNTGNTAMSVSTSSVSGPFAVSATTCGTTLNAGSTCTVSVTFKPTAMGAASGTLSIPTGEGTQSVSLSGTGLQSAVSLSYPGHTYGSSTIVWGNVQVGQTAGSGVFTVTNTGNVALSGLAVSAPTGWTVTSNTCASTLATSASCTFGLVFGPSAAQTYTGNVSVSATGASSVQYALNGTGTSPALVLDHINPSATGWTMPAYSSSRLGVYYRNSGYGPVTLTSLSISGAESAVYTAVQSDSCYAGNVLQPGARCWALPGWGGAPGLKSATLTMVSSAGTLTTNISATEKSLDVSVANNGAATTSSTLLTVTLTNNTAGNFAFTAPYLNLYSASGTGSWAIANNPCPAVLAANGGSCALTVRYTAGGAGAGSVTASPYGTFEFQDMFDGAVLTGSGRYRGGPVNAAPVTLSATSQASVATLTANANFGGAWYEARTAYASATYRNDGNSPMTLSPTASAPFGVSSNGCTNVAAGASCSIQYSLNLASTGGTYSVCPSITSSTGSVNSCATLSATIYSAVPEWSTTSLSFGTVQVGQSSTQSLTLYNRGGATAYNWAVAPQNAVANLPAGFSLDTSGCSNVAPNGGSCTVYVTFSPGAAQGYGGSSIHMAWASYLGNTLTVSGTGASPVMGQSTSSMSFPNTNVGQTSAAQSVTVTNSGYGPVTVNTPTVTANFGATHNCPATLNAGASCTVNVTFSPSSAVLHNGTLSIVTSAGTKTVTLSGVGVTPTPLMASTTAATRTSKTDMTGTLRTHTITWTWTNPASVAQTPTALNATTTSISVGVNTTTSTCKVGTAVPAGGTCTVVVTASGGLCSAGTVNSTVTTAAGTATSAVPMVIPNPCA